MKRINLYLMLLCGLLLSSSAIIAQNTITGNVIDDTGEPLIGANVLVKGTTEGSVTDLNGDFTLSTTQSFPFSLEISYTGYSSQTLEISNTDKLNITLSEGITFGEEIVISASRKREKIQEAPASISLITARKLAASPQTEPIRNLISVPGVQLQQQSAARINIEMRGSAGLFSTSVFPILDYRSLVGPGIGTFQSDAAGLSNIDLARIEVVRGPGSALYGPSVTAGVVHFISKNPIDYPGTSIQVAGGELNTIQAAVRHAGKNKTNTFGYKINAGYNRGDEFTLDPNNPEDSIQIAKFKTQVVQPQVVNGTATFEVDKVLLTNEDLDEDNDGNPMQDFWQNSFANATLEFRPQDDLSVFVSGGYNQASAVFYNTQGEGLSQQTEFWGQARFQKGGLFGQVFYVDNDGGTEKNPTFLYQTGNRSPIGRKQLEGQLQYNFGIKSFLNADFTAGVDYRQAKSETLNLVYGRNENDDDYEIIGGYLQGKFAITPKLDLVLAGRYDQFNFIDEGEFAPRAALVFKPNPKHTVRASYNKANAPNTALQANIDFPLADAGAFAIWLLGNKEPITWDDNPGTTLFIPGNPTFPGTGAPTGVAYGALTPTLLPLIQAGIESNPSLAPFWMDIQNIITGTNLTGFSQGVSVDLDGAPLMPQNVGTSQVRIDNQYEIGYKGLIADKLSVTFDWYYITRENFTDLGTVTPLVAIPNMPTDLGNDVTASITPQLVQLFIDNGFPQATAEATAAAVAGTIAGAYTSGATQGGLNGVIGLQSGIDRLPEFSKPLMAWGYRTFPDKYEYWGIDFGVEYYIDEALSVFGNFSYLSKTDFNDADLGEPGSGRSISLSQPDNKFRVGINYIPVSKGWRGSASFQHDSEFFAAFGQFAGDVPAKNLIDAAVGYNFGNGLSLDIAANNLSNSEYRAFPGFPKIGRRILAKVTYNFGGE